MHAQGGSTSVRAVNGERGADAVGALMHSRDAEARHLAGEREAAAVVLDDQLDH